MVLNGMKSNNKISPDTPDVEKDCSVSPAHIAVG